MGLWGAWGAVGGMGTGAGGQAQQGMGNGGGQKEGSHRIWGAGVPKAPMGADGEEGMDSLGNRVPWDPLP